LLALVYRPLGLADGPMQLWETAREST